MTLLKYGLQVNISIRIALANWIKTFAPQSIQLNLCWQPGVRRMNFQIYVSDYLQFASEEAQKFCWN